MRPTSGASSCVLRGCFASELEDPQARRVAERLEQLDELRRRRAAQALDEVRRAVDDRERPGRVAVDAHVRPHVDARHEQQRVLGADRDAVVVRDVEPEAARRPDRRGAAARA